MPEYWIQAVRYVSPNGPIEVVLAAAYDAGRHSLAAPATLARDTVIHWLKGGVTFYTSHHQNGWHKGVEVKVTEDGRFITTAPNGWVYDNLESLPRF